MLAFTSVLVVLPAVLSASTLQSLPSVRLLLDEMPPPAPPPEWWNPASMWNQLADRFTFDSGGTTRAQAEEEEAGTETGGDGEFVWWPPTPGFIAYFLLIIPVSFCCVGAYICVSTWLERRRRRNATSQPPHAAWGRPDLRGARVQRGKTMPNLGPGGKGIERAAETKPGKKPWTSTLACSPSTSGSSSPSGSQSNGPLGGGLDIQVRV